MTVNLPRRKFAAGLAATASAWPLRARAQQGDRVRRIGVLMALAASDPEAQRRASAFVNGLRDLGWVEGRNLHIDYRWGAGDAGVLRKQAAELVASAPDVILAVATPTLAALHEQSRTLPIVFAQVTDPVGQGLVSNLARPGGNVTGFMTFEFSMGSKWLQILKEVAPAVKRVAAVFNPATAPFAELFWPSIEAAASSFSINPNKAPVSDIGDIEKTIEGFAREPNGALLVLPDTSTTGHRDLIIALASGHRLPAVYPLRIFADGGGLLSYGTDVADILRRAADYVHRVLRGTNPGELPVQQPSKYELVINLKTAKTLGLAVPPTLLALANDVIE
jgi:putative tryptophan/tyrosine transport system substrate-binding protein